jgi:hypothetical protein
MYKTSRSAPTCHHHLILRSVVNFAIRNTTEERNEMEDGKKSFSFALELELTRNGWTAQITPKFRGAIR